MSTRKFWEWFAPAAFGVTEKQASARKPVRADAAALVRQSQIAAYKSRRSSRLVWPPTSARWLRRTKDLP